MAAAKERSPRTRSAAFAGYVLIAVLVVYYLSPRLVAMVDPARTGWIWAAYVLLGASLLAAVCVGAVRRGARLDRRIDELEAEDRAPRPARVRPISKPATREVRAPPGSLEQDVDKLLQDLHALGEAAAAEAGVSEPTPAAPEPVDEDAEGVRAGRSREIDRLKRVRDALAATAMGPAVASLGVIGTFAALLPATDGMLLADLQFNAFLEFVGLACLIGTVGYAALAFRALSRRA